MSQREAAQNAVRNRQVSSKQKQDVRVSQDDLRFFSSDSNGLQLHPKTVLLISIIYMGIVVILHIFGKLRQNDVEAQ